MKHKYFNIALALFIITSAVLFNYSAYITNKFGPGGNGHRIFPYMEFVNHADAFYPLWNPYISGGVPTMADPERFILLGKFIDVSYKYSNLLLNLVFIALLLAISIAAYFLARELSISNEGAVLVGIVLGCSQLISLRVEVGAFFLLISIPFTFIAVIFYKKYIVTKKLWYIFLSSIISGLIISWLGYHSIEFYVVIMFLAGLYLNKSETNIIAALCRTTAQVSVQLFSGIIFFSIFIFPLIYYQTTNLIDLQPLGVLSRSLPQFGTVVNTFVPFYPGAKYSFISLATLPLMTILLFNKKYWKDKPTYIFLFGAGVSLSIMLGVVYPFKYMLLLFEKVPILKYIRHNELFRILFGVSIAYLSGYGYDTIETHESSKRINFFLPLLAIVFLISAALIIDILQGYQVKGTSTFWRMLNGTYIFSKELDARWKVLGLLILLLMPYTKLKNKNLIRLYIVGLIVVQLLLVKHEARREYKAKNKPIMPRIIKTLQRDTTYYRVMNLVASSNVYLGMPTVRKVYSFSNYFSREHRWQLEHLFDGEIKEGRPQWVWIEKVKNEGILGRLNMNAMELLNIKYIIASKKYRLGGELSEDDWKLVAVEKRGWGALWQKKDWKSSLRIYDKWAVEESVESVQKELRRATYNPYERVFLECDPGITQDDEGIQNNYKVEVSELKTEYIKLRVSSNKNGILFVPENYDTGWKARINDKPAEIIRANASYRGIPVTKGQSTVELYYSPWVVYVGGIVSLVSIMGAALGIAFFQKKRRRFLKMMEEAKGHP